MEEINHAQWEMSSTSENKMGSKGLPNRLSHQNNDGERLQVKYYTTDGAETGSEHEKLSSS